MNDFYDQLTPYYHLIYPDWDASLRRQGRQLAALIRSEWPGSRKLLDLACGIGTQAIGLALNGFAVTASDLSCAEVERARLEASRRELALEFSVCDMRQAHAHHGGGFDIVICCDNSIPHLLSDEEILTALRQMHQCLHPGGGCLLSVRDYAQEEHGRNILKPYGVRIEGDTRYLLFQVWDFEGDFYDFSFFIVEEHLPTHQVQTSCHALALLRYQHGSPARTDASRRFHPPAPPR